MKKQNKDQSDYSTPSQPSAVQHGIFNGIFNGCNGIFIYQTGFAANIDVILGTLYFIIYSPCFLYLLSGVFTVLHLFNTVMYCIC